MNFKPLEPVEYIVIHCSANTADSKFRLKDIDLEHRKRGWLACGYHLVIPRDGTLEFGRPLDRQGAHVRSYNHKSIGVCLVGGIRIENGIHIPEDNFTENQLRTLRFALAALQEMYPMAKVVGHNELDARKACPVLKLEDYGLR
jgi:N-acetyl-anhydromuramyl-L-alanine amidase AmpD